MHRDDRSGSCRSLSPPICEQGHYNHPLRKHKKPIRIETLWSRTCSISSRTCVPFVHFCGIISVSVATHVALSPPVEASCFREKSNLWLRIILNTRQLRSSTRLLNNAGT